MCKNIVSDVETPTIIAFGNWVPRKGLKMKHIPPPLCKIKDKLKRMRNVQLIEINEHLTSKTCSECGSEVSNIKEWKWNERTSQQELQNLYQVNI
jgi:hypothetical protein